MKPFLKKTWNKRAKFLVKGDKLLIKADKLYAKGSKFHVEGSKFRAEGSTLHIEGNKLYTERVIDYYGSKAIIHWSTGEVEGDILAIPVGELKGEDK